MFEARGWYVQQGMKIGYVSDLFGKTVWEARAPSGGVVLYVCSMHFTRNS
jgi:hypothetical protein